MTHMASSRPQATTSCTAARGTPGLHLRGPDQPTQRTALWTLLISFTVLRFCMQASPMCESGPAALCYMLCILLASAHPWRRDVCDVRLLSKRLDELLQRADFGGDLAIVWSPPVRLLVRFQGLRQQAARVMCSETDLETMYSQTPTCIQATCQSAGT